MLLLPLLLLLAWNETRVESTREQGRGKRKGGELRKSVSQKSARSRGGGGGGNYNSVPKLLDRYTPTSHPTNTTTLEELRERDSLIDESIIGSYQERCLEQD
jgi:hypothetical protein